MIISEKQLQDERAKVVEAGQDQLEPANNVMDDAPPPAYSECVQDAQIASSLMRCAQNMIHKCEIV